MKKKLAQEKEQDKRNALEVKQHIEINAELKQKLRESDTKRIEYEKRLLREIKELRKENEAMNMKMRSMQAESVKFKPLENE